MFCVTFLHDQVKPVSLWPGGGSGGFLSPIPIGETACVPVPEWSERGDHRPAPCWKEFSYLQGRSTLRRVFVLIDARHGLKKNDDEVLDLLDKAAVSYQLVLTKADKIKPPALKKLQEATLLAIAKRPAAFPQIVATSSEKGIGIDDLKAAILYAAGLAD